MAKLIINDRGGIYGYMFEGEPKWYRTRNEKTVFSQLTAEAIHRQLTGLGHRVAIVQDSAVGKGKHVSEITIKMLFPAAGGG
jgi:hypothetical protein